MKILLNRKPVEGPWGGGNLFISNFYDYFAKDNKIVYQLEEDIDIIFMHDPRPGNTGISVNEIIGYKSYRPETKIYHRVNECDARKGTEGVDIMLGECSKYTDCTLFVSEWMKNYHVNKGWFCKDNHVLYNGVNLQHFKKGSKLNNGKINIVTHHWSNNLLKGFDIYDKIDDFVGKNKQYTFTYIGRERGTFKNTSIVEPLHGEDLGTELTKYDVYVSASRFDPGPNHILESLACNIPTYVHSDGGGCVEFAGIDHTFSNFNELKILLLSRNFTNNEMLACNWHDSMVKLEQIMFGEDRK